MAGEIGWLQPVTLQGRHVRLEPLTLDHVPALAPVALDPELWRLTVANIATEADLRAYVQAGLRDRDAGLALPFATMDVATGQAIGSTRFANASFRDRRVEIGWTWLGRAWQRTAANTEAKYLMLGHAFDVLGCVRVELKTDGRNDRSRAAMLRIGAREEGTLRRHMAVQGGHWRDTVYFSILDDEWPAIRDRLRARLGIASEG
ncbi:MAG TPA: GNAT family protein [Longimicrobiaceae bacterium]|nr:GNAT family protein [Longimicrobiaceae bacterium]